MKFDTSKLPTKVRGLSESVDDFRSHTTHGIDIMTPLATVLLSKHKKSIMRNRHVPMIDLLSKSSNAQQDLDDLTIAWRIYLISQCRP